MESSSIPLARLKSNYSYSPVPQGKQLSSKGTPSTSILSIPTNAANESHVDDSHSVLLPPDDPHDSPTPGRYEGDRSSLLPKAWRFGAFLASIAAACVLLINFIIAIWAYVKSGKRSSGHVYEGSCDAVDGASIGIHLVINVLSSLLLGACNYMMQCLCAPTRREVDMAHGQGTWLEIAQPSLRNLTFVRLWKRLSWITLALSSLPLHLFYNSSFYSSLAHNDYDLYFASEKYLEGDAFNATKFPSPGTQKFTDYTCFASGTCFEATWETDLNAMQEEALRFERLENKECNQAYAQDFLVDRRNIILVVEDLDNTTSSLYDIQTYQLVEDGYDSTTSEPYYWICSHEFGYWKEDYAPCNNVVGKIEAAASDWSVYGYRVRYCQSEKVEPKCRLNFNLPVLGIVIAFNAIKLVSIIFATQRMRDEPLITLGDAVASFLRSPDATTRGMCLATRAHFQRTSKGQDWSQAIESPMTYQPRKMRWMSATTKKHWLCTVLLFAAALATTLGLLAYAVPHLRTSFGQSGLSSFWNLGLGKARSQTMIQGWAIPTSGESALISAILVANSPQLILSLIYVVFNGLATRLLLAREWASYARHRKPLRVSSPHGEQRSTYFLQIPYRYGLPLMLYMTALHWLISQSIFLAKVDVWDANGVATQRESITTCGFSPIGMIITSIVAARLITTALALGVRGLDSETPFAGSCSAAISAACHAREDVSETAPLKWGAPSREQELGEIVGHCAFLSNDVEKPVPGNVYA